MRFLPLVAFALSCTLAASRAADPRGDNPDAAPQTPEQEQAQFHLPPGFEIQLVASEPEIQKPMNLNFDAAGRLWVTGSEMYPWPASVDAVGNPIPDFEKAYGEIASAFGTRGKEPAIANKSRDTVRVLSDFDTTGRAQKIEILADGLNVPPGVQPLPRAPGAKGDTVIVYSIPYIWRMEDTDGDGKADKREILYGPMGFLDTHGGSSSYIQWIDGWIYGTHGFRNHSPIKDRNGKELTLDSGNTYRFKPDGTAFEYYTHGQTNPFGLAFDPLGNLYSADSHSKPVYMLLRGGYYEGIGKQHDGLGFAPRITDDDHGSSAIAGIAYYADDKFPDEYRGNLFNGNPVTRRVNRDKLEWHGSSPKAIRQEDFITSDDPWFRPVQVKLGPDGALYIADFYNAIIGHYEFPLADPRRDHSHGRIWRIVYKGVSALPKMSELDAAGLIEQLGSANLETRRLATNELVERLGKDAVAPLQDFSMPRNAAEFKATLKSGVAAPLQWKGSNVARAHALWALSRLGGVEQRALDLNRIDPGEMQQRPFGSKEPIAPRYPALFGQQMANESGATTETFALRTLSFLHTFFGKEAAATDVYRTAEWARLVVDGTSRHPSAAYVEKLQSLVPLIPKDDPELLYTTRMALRDCLAAPGGFARATTLSASGGAEVSERLAQAALGARSPESAAFVLSHLQRAGLATARAGEYVRHVGQNLEAESLGTFASALQQLALAAPFQQRLRAADALGDSIRKRGVQLPAAIQGWLDATVIQALGDPDLDVVKAALVAVKEMKTEAKRAPLQTFATNATLRRDVRTAALEAAANLPRAEEILVPVLKDPTDIFLRRRAAELLGQIDSDAARAALATALPTAPGEVALSIAGALVQRESGARLLVDTIAAGKASPLVLRNKLVALQIERKAPALAPRVAELTAGLPSEDARLDKVISSRVDAFERATAKRADIRPLNTSHGEQLFKQTCAVCHKFRNDGANIGPNLDGVVARGVHRLVEDILDPNRNVDPAFRQTVLETKDVRTVAGVNLREEGPTLTLNDVTGAAISIPKDQVKSQTASRLSLMPPAFEQLMPAEDLNDLLAYLLTPAK